MIPFLSIDEAHDRETRGQQFGDARNSDGWSTGWRVIAVQDARAAYPEQLDAAEGWLLVAVSERNTPYGFTRYYSIQDAVHTTQQVIPAAAWWKQDAMQRILGKWFDDRTEVAMFLRDAIGTLTDRLDEQVATDLRVRVQRYNALRPAVKTSDYYEQWGPSPNEAGLFRSHNLKTLWKTGSLAAAAIDDFDKAEVKRVERRTAFVQRQAAHQAAIDVYKDVQMFAAGLREHLTEAQTARFRRNLRDSLPHETEGFVWEMAWEFLTPGLPLSAPNGLTNAWHTHWKHTKDVALIEALTEIES